MSTTLQQVKVGRTQIWVEVEPTAPAGAGDGKFTSTSGRTAREAVSSLTQADIAGTLHGLLAPIHKALREIGPNEVQVELALGIKGEVGVFVAKGEGNASLKVTAKWTFEKPAVASGPETP
jgi:hypothetical protein